MSNRLTWLLAILLGLVFASPLEAQFGLFGGRRRSNREERFNQDRGANPRHEQAKREAEQAQQRGDYRRTEDLASRVLRENPRDHVAYYLRASARVELGLREGASELLRTGISDAREAIRLDPDRRSMYYLPYLYGMKSLAALENRKEHAETAAQVASQVLELAGLEADEKANLLYQRAQANAYLQQYDTSVADYQEAIRLSPTHVGAHLGLADVLAAAGRADDALAAFGRAIESAPENPLVYNNRGMYLQQQGKHAEAVLDFSRAIQIEPNYLYSYTNRGYSLMEMGDAEAAEADFSTSLGINDQQPAVFNLRGSARMAQKNVQGAIEDQRMVLRFQPEDPVAHSNLGFAQFFAEDYAAALSSFDRALQFKSDLRYLQPWRFWAMHSLGQTERAKSEFAEVLDVEPDERDWVNDLLLFLLGNLTDAELLAAVDQDEEPVRKDQLCEAHFFIGLKNRAEGQAEESADHFRKSIETGSRHLSAYRGSQIALK